MKKLNIAYSIYIILGFYPILFFIFLISGFIFFLIPGFIYIVPYIPGPFIPILFLVTPLIYILSGTILLKKFYDKKEIQEYYGTLIIITTVLNFIFLIYCFRTISVGSGYLLWFFLILSLMTIGMIITIIKMPSKKINKINKKKIIIITLLIVGIIILASILYSLGHHYEININRTYSNNAEKKAIQKAEELDLTTLLNTTRYGSGWGDEGTNNPPSGITANVWPNIIDKKMLQFYSNKIEKLRISFTSVHAYLNYKVKSELNSKIFILYNNISQKIIINNQTYSISFNNHFYYDSYSPCAIEINNRLEVISLNTIFVQINISNGYVVTQHFDYEETYGPLAGFGGGVEQVIILDQNYLPKVILSRNTGGWIS
jgi:hypothetical protein